MRSTRIRTEEKTYISVPNKQMVDSIIDNLSLRTQRRVVTNLELSLSATVSQLKELSPAIQAILQRDEIISSSVYLKDTGTNAHKVEVMYYTDINQTLAAFNAMHETINLSIIELLEKMNLPLAAKNSNVFVLEK